MGDRLDSWKDIASYLGREVRTVQRWEDERHLPVHRLPGGDKPHVYALKSELDMWLRVAPRETAGAPSVAVLPFANLAGDKENEYFGDGLGDDIIDALTRIPGLRVTARTSSFAFRGKEQDVREIGARLGVIALVEGSVRRSGGRVRISVQLVSTENGYHLWSQTYDRELTDIFAIQEEVARSTAQALSVRLTPAPLVPRFTEDMEAYDLWLKGRCAAARWTPAGFAEAHECFAAALARDPRFPLPYVAIAESLFESAWFEFIPPLEAAPRAKELVLKALALDDRLGEAHAVLGSLCGVFEYDWAAAEQAFGRALELSPRSPAVLLRHAFHFLVPRLLLTEAIEELRSAVAQDPLSARLHTTLGLTLLLARDLPASIKHCRTAADLAPELWAPRWFLGGALMGQGRADEALAQFRSALETIGPVPMALGGMCCVNGLLGRPEEARHFYGELEKAARAAPVQPLAYGWAYLGLGDDRVFQALDQAVEAREPGVTCLPSLLIYDGIRGDPRFPKLVDKMGLGDAARRRATA
jgi:TolB-like protein